jgi:hypothetical protein
VSASVLPLIASHEAALAALQVIRRNGAVVAFAADKISLPSEGIQRSHQDV